MNEIAHDVATVRAAEEAALAAASEGALMQRAAAGLATVCLAELRSRRGRVTGSRVVLLVGAGNNGGDALWAGSSLAGRGVRVDALLLARSAHAEGLTALRAAGARVVVVSPDGGDRARELLTRADLVVDGIVGLGGAPGLREPAASLVAALDGVARRPCVVAVDLPSGVDADGGTTPAPHVRADVTVTFGALKPCLLLPPAARAAGVVHLVDIGLRPYLPAAPAVDRITGSDAARLWPRPGPEDDKYTRGVVGVVAGSASYTGAAVLSVGGALRAGAGMVRYTGPTAAADQVRARWPEAVVGRGRVQAWVLGSGVDPGAGDGQDTVIAEALGSGLPAVVDAGALEVISRPGPRSLLNSWHVTTPHAGELARLLTTWGGSVGATSADDVRAAPLAHARWAAELTGTTVLLKGSITVIAAPDGRCRTSADAPAVLATAGAGDVLAGIAGTLLAAGLDPFDAAGVAAFAHARAAALASRGGIAPIVAGDVVAAVPDVVAELRRDRCWRLDR
ncbi:MAG: ADP-dependent NAD(P)H-hydrate dehydratase / NAD(P)H-hydrate epimerase [Actinomycetota bacterium]|nr:ADP-dependent NAD(P)H-hydrate dehydratase / NAD(P)H-hydrate epimerase [Actinomycetota bacterium]